MGDGSSTLITILFTDLVGSTELLDRVGDERAEVLRRTHFALLRDAVRQHSGLEVKSMGDGLMVVFPSVLGALDAAVAMQQGVQTHNDRDPEHRFDVRVGLHVGEPIRAEEDYFGRPVVVARRLCDSAEGGQILASELVAELARDRSRHSLTALGPRSLKGLSGEVAVVNVEWEPAGPEPLPEPLTYLGGDFAGRHAEIERMVSAWKGALGGERRTMLIGGEPGIGKTRLAAELARRVADSRGKVLFGRCDEDLSVAYEPWREALRPLLATAARSLSDRSLAELARLWTEVADLSPGLPEPVQGDAEIERRAVFDGVVELLRVSSEQRPLLLVLDDLHWADRASLLLLRHVLQVRPAPPIAVAGTFRDTDLDRTHPLTALLADLRREEGVERIALRGLDAGEVEDLLTRTAGQDLDQMELELAAALHRETQGNPFFVLALLAHLAESGAIHQVEGRWTSDVAVSELGLPEGVREVIGRRLGRLQEETVAVLRVAAVVGPRFDALTVEAVLDRADDSVLDALDEAVAAGLVDPESGSTFFSFSHALVRQALLDELSGARRTRLHRRIAEALEESGGHDIGALAFHYTEAAVDGVAAKAAEYALEAARTAIARVAYEEAATHLERGIEALGLEAPLDLAKRASMHLLLADVSGRLAGRDASHGPARHAAEDALAVGDVELLVAAAMLLIPDDAGNAEREAGGILADALTVVGPDHPALRSKLLSFYAVDVLARSGRVEEAMVLFEEAFELAKRSGDRVALARAQAARLFAFESLGEIEAMTRTMTALEELDVADESEVDVILADVRGAIAFGALVLGDVERFDRAIQLVEERHNQQRTWADWYWHQALSGVRAQIDGRFSDVEAIAAGLLGGGGTTTNAANVASGQLLLAWRDQGRQAQALPLIAARLAQEPWVAGYRAVVALLAAETGDFDQARAVLAELVADDYACVPRDPIWPAVLVLCAETAATLGEAQAAGITGRLLASRSGLLAVGGAGTLFFGSVDRYLAMTAATVGEVVEAERLYRAALVLEQRVGARPAMVHTGAWLGALLVDDGRGEEARAVLEPALAEADALGMAHLSRRVSELLART